MCNVVHSVSTMTVLYSQQRTASASNRSEDFLHVSEVAVSRVAVCDAQHDLR